MIQSVSSASSVSQLYQQQQRSAATNKPKAVHKPEQQDSVELSQQAQAAAQANQNSDRR